MHLPGRLRATTLGDLLGTLHRAEASGTLELVDDRGRAHRVHLARGLVIAVEVDAAGATLAEVLRRERAVDDDTLKRSLLRALSSRRLHGEVLVDDFLVPATVIGAAVRGQIVSRLLLIDQLTDARVHFRVAVRAPRSALREPLAPRDFLSGRRRARDAEPHGTPPPRAIAPARDTQAWRVLGIAPGADAIEIKRAFRRRARELHPDLHPHATDAERRDLETRFAEVTAAYRMLVA
jgi:hypothetical protein